MKFKMIALLAISINNVTYAQHLLSTIRDLITVPLRNSARHYAASTSYNPLLSTLSKDVSFKALHAHVQKTQKICTSLAARLTTIQEDLEYTANPFKQVAKRLKNLLPLIHISRQLQHYSYHLENLQHKREKALRLEQQKRFWLW